LLGDAKSWVTLRARWVTLTARWVTLRARCSLGDAKRSLGDRKWAGLLLSAAAIGVDWDAGKLVAYGVFSTLARFGFKPQWALLPQFVGRELCRDAEGAKNYDEDPLNYHGKLKVWRCFVSVRLRKGTIPQVIEGRRASPLRFG
jgi:hypothetical protein